MVAEVVVEETSWTREGPSAPHSGLAKAATSIPYDSTGRVRKTPGRYLGAGGRSRAAPAAVSVSGAAHPGHSGSGTSGWRRTEPVRRSRSRTWGKTPPGGGGAGRPGGGDQRGQRIGGEGVRVRPGTGGQGVAAQLQGVPERDGPHGLPAALQTPRTAAGRPHDRLVAVQVHGHGGPAPTGSGGGAREGVRGPQRRQRHPRPAERAEGTLQQRGEAGRRARAERVDDLGAGPDPAGGDPVSGHRPAPGRR
ncbi:hypothetical protein GCM10020254_74120 [Streptomyces goshikiensis]